MDGCTALVKRMPLHLKKVHKLLLDSVEFKATLSRVRRLVSDSVIPGDVIMKDGATLGKTRVNLLWVLRPLKTMKMK